MNLNQPIEVPQSAIGVVEEAIRTSQGPMTSTCIVFPGHPMPGANAYTGSFVVMGRMLHLLGPGESLTVQWSVPGMSGKDAVANDNGRARVQRVGLMRLFLGPGTRYKDPQPPCSPRS